MFVCPGLPDAPAKTRHHASMPRAGLFPMSRGVLGEPLERQLWPRTSRSTATATSPSLGRRPPRGGRAGSAPREGYRVEIFRRPAAGKLRLPMLSAAVSAEHLFDTFLQLIEPLGEVVHVVLESSHGSGADRHTDLRRTHIDLPVLASHFCRAFEDLADPRQGVPGVAVLAGRPAGRGAVRRRAQIVSHVYARDLKPFLGGCCGGGWGCGGESSAAP